MAKRKYEKRVKKIEKSETLLKEPKKIEEKEVEKEKETQVFHSPIVSFNNIKEKPKTKLVKKFFATYKGDRKSITLSPRIGKVVRGVPFEITEDDANTLVGGNFAVEVRYEHVKI